MRIVVKIKLNARKDEVENIGDGEYMVHSTAIPVEEKVNEKVIALIAAYFGVEVERLRVVRGGGAHHKIIEIL